MNANQNPSLSVVKTITGPATYTAAGQQRGFHVEAKNTGNVTVLDLHFTDPKADSSIGACGAPTLAPGATLACDFVYTVQGFDLGFGNTITSATTVTGTYRPLVGPNSVTGVSNSTTLTPRPGADDDRRGRCPVARRVHRGRSGDHLHGDGDQHRQRRAEHRGRDRHDGRRREHPVCGDDVEPQRVDHVHGGAHDHALPRPTRRPPSPARRSRTPHPTGGGPPISATANVITIAFSTSSSITISKTVVTSPGHPAEFSLVGDVVQVRADGDQHRHHAARRRSRSAIRWARTTAGGAPEAITSLAPGEAKGCVVTKTIVAADLGHDLTNTATVSATLALRPGRGDVEHGNRELRRRSTADGVALGRRRSRRSPRCTR